MVSPTTRFVSIQTKMLRVTIPLVLLPIVILGSGWFLTAKKEESARRAHFLSQRIQDLMTISEIPAIRNYFINRNYGPQFQPEATRFRKEIEQYLRSFLIGKESTAPPVYMNFVLLELVRDERGTLRFGQEVVNIGLGQSRPPRT